MIRVYVREVNEEEGALLGEFYPEDILELPELFQRFDTGTRSGRVAHFAHGQFVCDATGAYFEIIVTNE